MNNNTVYRNNSTNKESRIVKEDENFYIMNNGDYIKKEIFMDNFTPLLNDNILNTNNMRTIIQENDTVPNDYVNPTDFLNTQSTINKYSETGYMKNKDQTQQGYTAPSNVVHQQDTLLESVSVDEDVIDPTSFMESSNNASADIQQQLASIDPRLVGDKITSNRVIDKTSNRDITGNIMESPLAVTNISNNSMATSDSRSIEERKQDLLDEYKRNNPVPNQPQVPVGFVSDEDRIITTETDDIDQETGLTASKMAIRKQHLDLGGDDPFADKIAKYRESKDLNPLPVVEKIDEFDTEVGETEYTNTSGVKIIISAEEKKRQKEFSMFKAMFKDWFPIEINLEIGDKIAKPEFLKEAAMNLNGDIIDYYSDRIFNKMMDNTTALKEEIYKQVKYAIYGDEDPIVVVDEPVTFGKKKKIVKAAEVLEVKDTEFDYDNLKLTKSDVQNIKSTKFKFLKDGKVKDYTLAYAKKNNLEPV